MLPHPVVRVGGKGAGLKTLPIRFDSPHVAVGVVTVKNRSLSPLAELFLITTKEFTSVIEN